MIYLLTLLLTIVLFIRDREKTIAGVKLGIKKLIKNLPVFLNMIILVSISLYFVSDELIVRFLGESSGIIGLLLAILLGSISLMPGFIAFPLAGILLDKGVSYMVIGGFTTTLMMVGVLTYPIEKEFFGVRVTIIRNLISLLIALLVSVLVGIFYGEIII
ncbi:hypothetical protein BX659_11774 [Orenia metallireducens]|uniref:Uncharacterized protein n=1 Tax=Orenia metallireducens TaxID=1413210 RepID=A0A285HI87_9FIRM|nr:hypothetical protein [Orenia metallireducens]PRX27209.1 hypothetical protein BX659_11774 [Orenia metallireducens]SNY35374.1 hypothetical protein SAMN06265827_11974 [Orenia metallireducens]